MWKVFILERMAPVGKTKQKNDWLEWIKAILIAVLIAFFLKAFIFTTSIVEGESMEPTLEDGERVIFNKLVYILGEPERGDIIFINRPTKNYVKRIIGLPGETIEIRHSELFVDGEKVEQPFLNQEEKYLTGNIEPITIPEDSYYVMGDNRAISKDSRNGLGLVEEDDIIGRSEFVIYPFNELEITK